MERTYRYDDTVLIVEGPLEILKMLRAELDFRSIHKRGSRRAMKLMDVIKIGVPRIATPSLHGPIIKV
jgi:hypothetical protein